MNALSQFALSIFSATLMVVLAVGCAHDSTARTNPPVRTTSAVVQGPTGRTQPAVATNGRNESVPNLLLSSEVVDTCHIRFDDIDSAPKFNFDESLLPPGERHVLDQLATCLTNGPLKGRAVELVGRADPRGEQEYNFVLGENRADAVATYLLDLGIDHRQITETSRGKLDATGTDEAGWQRDRRVDIKLQ